MDTHGTFSIPSRSVQRLHYYGGDDAVAEFMTLLMVIRFGADAMPMLMTEVNKDKKGNAVVTWTLTSGTVQ